MNLTLRFDEQRFVRGWVHNATGHLPARMITISHIRPRTPLISTPIGLISLQAQL